MKERPLSKATPQAQVTASSQVPEKKHSPTWIQRTQYCSFSCFCSCDLLFRSCSRDLKSFDRNFRRTQALADKTASNCFFHYTAAKKRQTNVNCCDSSFIPQDASRSIPSGTTSIAHNKLLIHHLCIKNIILTTEVLHQK